MITIKNNNCQGSLLAGLLAGSFLLATAAFGADSPATAPRADSPAQPPVDARQNVQKFSGGRQSLYFKRNWGVDVIGVHPVSSGQMLAFRYRVLDEAKARALFNKTVKPYLVDEATGTRLAVPAMENVGELRQGVTPETDRIYYTIFGNPGKLVKPGSRVSIVIGNFHIEGLIVD